MLTIEREIDTRSHGMPSRDVPPAHPRNIEAYGFYDTLDLLRRYAKFIAGFIAIGTLLALILAVSLTKTYTTSSTLVFDRNDTRPYEVRHRTAEGRARQICNGDRVGRHPVACFRRPRRRRPGPGGRSVFQHLPAPGRGRARHVCRDCLGCGLGTFLPSFRLAAWRAGSCHFQFRAARPRNHKSVEVLHGRPQGRQPCHGRPRQSSGSETGRHARQCAGRGLCQLDDEPEVRGDYQHGQISAQSGRRPCKVDRQQGTGNRRLHLAERPHLRSQGRPFARPRRTAERAVYPGAGRRGRRACQAQRGRAPAGFHRHGLGWPGADIRTSRRSARRRIAIAAAALPS